MSPDYLKGYRAALVTIALAFGLIRLGAQDTDIWQLVIEVLANDNRRG